MTTNIIVCGAAGRMGTSIIRLAKQDPALNVAGALEYKGNPLVGTGDPKISDDLAGMIGSADVLIDFTTPAATMEHLAAAVKSGKPIVIGATGLKPEEIGKIKEAGQKIPVVFSPNYSVGVNIMFKIAREIAQIVPDYDMEILELHHNQKKDAPSGTAMRLADVIAEAVNRDMKEVGVYGRHGITGPRRKEEIGVMAIRAGDIVGDHTVFYAGPGERIELTHRAHSRDTLAAGAIVAAKWVVRQKPGLYDMQDVLGLKNR